MVEVVANILDNAIRYTPEGGQITMSAVSADNMVEIRIQDSGPGVAPDDLERIFERFYRTESSRSRDNGGSGLGFAIARSIVERLNGRIWAESSLGRGLTVVIRLPASQSQARTSA
jgi:signal transduction histidine kinase